jgi:hypothetical protein
VIIKRQNESALEAVARTGREMSTSPLVTSGTMATTHLYELIGVLAAEVARLEAEVIEAHERISRHQLRRATEQTSAGAGGSGPTSGTPSEDK